MAKEIEITLSDKSIKELYDIEMELGFGVPPFEDYYKLHKKPMKALFG